MGANTTLIWPNSDVRVQPQITHWCRADVGIWSYGRQIFAAIGPWEARRLKNHRWCTNFSQRRAKGGLPTLDQHQFANVGPTSIYRHWRPYLISFNLNCKYQEYVEGINFMELYHKISHKNDRGHMLSCLCAVPHAQFKVINIDILINKQTFLWWLPTSGRPRPAGHASDGPPSVYDVGPSALPTVGRHRADLDVLSGVISPFFFHSRISSHLECIL